MSRLYAVQAALLAELAKPGRAGDITDLVDALVDKGGAATNVDGSLNLDAFEDLVRSQAVRMAAAAVGVALQISPNAAQMRVSEAVDLVGGLPATVNALRYGEIDKSKAKLIADRTSVLEPDTRRLVEEDVIDLAKTRVPRQLRDLVDRAVIKVDPDAAVKRRRAARSGRDVIHRPQPDGMGWVSAYLPAEGALSFFTLLDLIAAKLRGTGSRSMGELRADAVVDIANGLLANGSMSLADLLDDSATGGTEAVDSPHSADSPAPPSSPVDEDQLESGCVEPSDADVSNDGGDQHAASGKESTTQAGGSASLPAEPDGPEIPVKSTGVIAAAAPHTSAVLPGSRPGGASGRSRRAVGCPTCGHGSQTWLPLRQGRPVDLVITMSLSTFAALDELPVHLAGHGAMTAEWGRTFAKAARSVTFVVLDPETGTAVGAGERVYRPRQRVRDQVTALSPMCSWPGCGQPAWKADLDHIEPFNHADPREGGSTTVVNLDPKCRWHHLLKTHGHWLTSRKPDGSTTLTAPTGHRAVQHPYPFTLPGEWLHHVDSPHREAIGSADQEHRSQLGPRTDDGPTPMSHLELALHRHLAVRRRHQRLRPDADRAPVSAVADVPTTLVPIAPPLPDDPPF